MKPFPSNVLTGFHSRRPVMLAIFFMSLLIPHIPLQAAEQLLAAERWREHSRGLSLQPPLGSRLLEMSSGADDALLRIAGEGNYFIKLYIKTRKEASTKVMAFDIDSRAGANASDAKDRARNVDDVPVPAEAKTDLTLDQIAELAIKQIANVQPGAVLVDQKRLDQPLPTVALYFKIPNPKRGVWMLGQSLTQIDGSTVAMLQLDVDPNRFEQVRPIFEAVAKSIQIENPAKLAQQRAEWLEQADRWLSHLDSKTLHAKLVPEQWLRIVDNGKDIGHMRLIQKRDRQMDQQGIRVDVQAHVEVGEQSVDSLANFFLSDDGQNEIWSIRTTTRPTKPVAADKTLPESLSTFAETGVRSKDKITVTRQSPAGNSEFHWDRPAKPATAPAGTSSVAVKAMEPTMMPLPYLSQVELQMIDTTLPHKGPLEVGFYAYNPAAGKISFRTERVVLQSDGSYLVYSRLTPEQPEQVSQFNASGKLIRRTLPNGQMLLPTTKAELAARAAHTR